MLPFNFKLNLETKIKKNNRNQKKGHPRIFEVSVNVDMQVIRNILSWVLPKKMPESIQSKKEEEQNLKTAQESSEELSSNGRELRTAESYCNVVTAREPKTSDVGSPVLHTSIERDIMENYKE